MVLPNLFSRKKTADNLSTLPTRQSSSSPEKDKPQNQSGRRSEKASRNKKSSDRSKRNSTSNKRDPESHPLNLPPDELRRFSTLSRSSRIQHIMDDTEMDGTRSPTPSSPSTNAPGAFPQTNGTNGDSHENAPAPPPHKAPASPPPTPQPQAPTVDAEACKAAGNKFFKAREWQKAISEYTKGWICPSNYMQLSSSQRP